MVRVLLVGLGDRLGLEEQVDSSLASLHQQVRVHLHATPSGLPLFIGQFAPGVELATEKCRLDSPSMLLRLDGISKSFGDRMLFSGVDLTVNVGDRIGLVGPNGAGKTTLLGVAAGDESQDGGRRSLARGVRVGVLRQEIDPDPATHRPRGSRIRPSAISTTSSASFASSRSAWRAWVREGDEIPPALAERYDRVHGSFSSEGGFERESRVERVLAGLGFDPDDRERSLCTFSGGWLMRVELAKLLLSEPDVLLLDEPTNHLDLPSIQWFEETLAEFKGGAIVISHDRTFLRRHVQTCRRARGRALHRLPGRL